MKKILLIRIPPPVTQVGNDSPVQWGIYSVSGKLLSDLHVSTIGELYAGWQSEQPTTDEEKLLPDQIVLLLSGALVVHRELAINPGQRKHLSTALSYMIEEQLAQDVDTMHLSSHLYRKEDKVSVSAIPHKEMQLLLALFDEQKLVPDHIFSEVQLLRKEPGVIDLLLDSGAVMMTSPDSVGINIDYNAVQYAFEQITQKTQHDDSILQDLANESAHNNLTQIRLSYSDGPFAPPYDRVERLKNWLTEQGWLISDELIEGTVFDFFVSGFFERKRKSTLVDLRVGPYQCPRKAGQRIRRWKPVLAVLICWIVLELGVTTGEAILYQQRAEDLWQQTMSEYLGCISK